MSLRYAAVFTAILFAIFAQSSRPEPASAAGCNGSFQVTGIIGQKWNDFNGPTSALGCPTSAQKPYQPGMAGSGLTNPGGTQQEFQHGTIVNYPSLGSNMLLSAWYNGANSIHVEFTGLATSYPHFYVGISNGAPSAGEKYIDFAGGTGHHADIPNPFPGAASLYVRLLPCSGTPYTCAPHMATLHGLKSEDSADGKIVVGISLYSSLSNGSLLSNGAPTAAPKRYAGGAPAPAPAAGVNTILNPTQVRGYAKADGGESSTFNFCKQDCFTPTQWIISTSPSFDTTQNTQAVVGPFVGYVYGTDKEAIKDGFSNVFSRYAMLFDLSTLPDKPIMVAQLQMHAMRSWVNFRTSGAICGTQLGVMTQDWWKDPSGSLDAADFSHAIAAGSNSSSEAIDVTAIVKNWIKNPSSNQGFVIRNSDENIGAFTEKSCFTQYDSSTLVVETQK